MENIKNCFKEGAITPEFIATSIAHHQKKTNIGAHQIFLGQVRADVIDGKEVTGIIYEAQEEMANRVFHYIRETTFTRFDLTCMHIYHSIGLVQTGEICLFVFVSSKHRKAVQEAIEFVVESIKKEAPIFGKEILDDASHVWKKNK